MLPILGIVLLLYAAISTANSLSKLKACQKCAEDDIALMRALALKKTPKESVSSEQDRFDIGASAEDVAEENTEEAAVPSTAFLMPIT